MGFGPWLKGQQQGIWKLQSQGCFANLGPTVYVEQQAI